MTPTPSSIPTPSLAPLPAVPAAPVPVRGPFRLFPEEPREQLYSLLLALYAAVLGYAWVLHITDALPSSPQKFWIIYEKAWAYGFAAALASALLWRVLQWLFFPHAKAYFPALLTAFHVAAVLTLLKPYDTVGLAERALKLSGYGVLGAFAVLRLARTRLNAILPLLEALALAAAPLLALGTYAWFNGPPAWDPLLSKRAAYLAVAVTLAASWEASRGGWKRLRWLDLAVLAAIVWAVFPWRPTYNLHHQAFYLDPANAVLNGRSLLHDIKCQYGVFHIYLIAASFKVLGLPASFYGFSVITGAAYVLQYAAIWFLLLRPMRSRALGLLALAALVAFNRFGFPGIGDDPLGYPSVGPWRFGISLLQLMAVWWRVRRPGRSRLPELALFGLVSVWSLECLVYSFAAYGAFSALELWEQEGGVWQRLRAVGTRFQDALYAALAANAVLALMIRAQSGSWPDYTLYFDYLKIYGGGLAASPLDFRTAWFLVASVPVAGLVSAVLLRLRGWKAPELALIAGLSAMAAAEFSYYLSRSHPSNLRFIILPTIVAAAVAMDLLLAQRSLSKLFRFASTLTVAALLALVLLQSTGVLLSAQPATRWVPEVAGRPGWAAMFETLRNPPSLHDRAAEAVRLAKKHFPGKREGTILTQGEACSVAHIEAGMIELGPYTCPEEDEITPNRITGVLDPALQAGDIVIVEGNPALYNGIQAERYNSLAQRFYFETVECGPQNMCAKRLVVNTINP